MMVRHAVASVLVLVSALTGCGGGEPHPDPVGHTGNAAIAPTPASEVILAQDGLGDLRLDRARLSLSVSDVESALGELRPKPQTEDCGLGTKEELGLAVVYNDDTAVVGFVTDNPGVSTPEGISVGSTSEDLAKAYGDELYVDEVVSHTGGPLRVVGDLDDPGAAPGPSTLHYGFDTDEAGTVTRMRAGFWPWSGYADYCSPEAENPHRTGWPLVGSR